MAWPSDSIGEPNYDTGPGVGVPAVDTLLTGPKTWLLGAHFSNDSGSAITVIMTDSSGGRLLKLKIPTGGEQPYEWPFRPSLGVRWSASAAGLVAHVWGYQ